MPYIRTRKRRCSKVSGWLWAVPFLGLCILIVLLIQNKPQINNPDGSCTNIVIRMFDTKEAYQQTIKDGSPIAELYHIPPYNNFGFCLDGSEAAFYYRPAPHTNKWQIYFEGGAFCFDYKTCSKRTQHRLGSSLSYKKYAWFNSEYLSTNKHINKLSYDFNTIFVRYCDGMTYLANRKLIDVFDGNRIYFQGYQILQNLLKYLFVDDNGFALQLKQASDVIFGGGGAGGLALLYHANYIWNGYIKNLQRKNENFKFMLLIESGYFRLVHRNTDKNLLWLYEKMDIEESLNEKCVQYYSQNDVCFAGDKDCVDGKKYYCLFLQYLMNFIDKDIKIFLLQSRFDFNYKHKERKKLIEGYNKMGEEYTAFIMNEFLQINDVDNKQRMNRGAFVSSCKHHCGQFNNIEIDEYVVSEAIFEFYYSEQNGTDRNLWFQKHTYPCDDCCFIQPFSAHHPAKVHGCELSE